MVGKGALIKSEYLRFVYRVGDDVDFSFSSSRCTSHTFSLLVFHSFMRAFRACTMSSMMSSCRLCMLPRGSVDGGPAILSRRLPNADRLSKSKSKRKREENGQLSVTLDKIFMQRTLQQTHLLLEGKAAIDSRLLRPKMVAGTLEMVTTE